MGIKTGLMDPRLKVGGEHADYYGFYKQLGLIELLDATDEAILSWIAANTGKPRQLDDLVCHEATFQNLLDFLAVS